MPKSILCTDSKLDSIKSDIRVAITTAETRRNVSRAMTIKNSGMSASNFYKAWNDPELFRIRDLHSIYEYLKIPDQERRFV